MTKPGIRPIYDIATAQGGYFTTAQAESAGVSRRALTYHVETNDLVRVSYGIYRIAHFPEQPFEDVIVACLWAGPDTAASYETALAVYGLTDVMPSKIHITVPRRFRGHRIGVVVHNDTLGDDERTVRDGVPVTTVARTFVDTARTSEAATVAAAANEALQRGLISARGLRRIAQRDPLLAKVLANVLLEVNR